MQKTFAQMQRHGSGCLCPNCLDSRLVKRSAVEGNFASDAHLARANALHHEQRAREHNSKVWGEGHSAMPVQKKAMHLAASSAHEAASHHFNQASRAFEEERPMAAKEHLGLAENHKKTADKLTGELS